MQNIKNAYPELDAIQQDLVSLKSNTAGLVHHAKEDGIRRASELSDRTLEMYEEAKTQGRLYLARAESAVRENPAKGLAYAFAGGFLASLLLRRR